MTDILHGRILPAFIIVSALLTGSSWAQVSPPPIPDDPGPGYLSYLAGGRAFGEGGPALTAFITDRSVALDLDAQGRLYVASAVSDILRVESDKTISSLLQVFPLLGDFVVSKDYVYYLNYPIQPSEDFLLYRLNIHSGMKETYASLDRQISGDCCEFDAQIAVDSTGTVFISNQTRIFKIDSMTGETLHFAGNGDRDYSGDGMPATDASLVVADMAIDPANDSLVIADSHNGRISRILPDSGQISSSAALNLGQYLNSINAISSVDVHPSGDIYLTSTDQSRIYKLSAALGNLTAIAGTGISERSGDGGPALSAGIRPEEIAIGSDGNYYFSSEAIHESLRVRAVDVSHDVVSTIVGIPGFLGCASPFDSRIVFSRGIETDSNGIIYSLSFNAILAFDIERNFVYTVAGIYGTKGDSEDGVPAYGNALRPHMAVHSAFSIASNGNIYFVEEDRIRSIDGKSGLLGTLATGKYRTPQAHPDGHLYAIREHDDWVDFVKINMETGVITDILIGGAGAPVVGESAAGRMFQMVTVFDVSPGTPGQNLNDVAVDSDGNFYLSINHHSSPGLPSGIYKIDGQSGTLSAVVSEDPQSTRSVQGQLTIDNDRHLLYYTFLTDSFYDPTEYVPVVKVDLETGQQTRIAGQNIIGDGYNRDGFGQNPYETLLSLIDLTVAENGDVYLLQNEDTILRITSSPPLGPVLIPEDIAGGSNLGTSVANNGNWLAVGVPNNPQSNGSSGEVLIYQDNDCRPVLHDRLNIPDAFVASQFGSSLTFAGNSLVIGASGQEATSQQKSQTGAASVKGSTIEADSIFKLGVFTLKNTGHWSFSKDLSSHLPSLSGGSKTSLVSDKNSFAVGAPDASDGKGQVTVFSVNSLDAPLKITSSRAGASNFGKSIAISNSKLAVGANSDSAGASVETFESDGSQYIFTAVIDSPDSNPSFATALEMNEEALYIGSPKASGGRVFDYSLAGMSLFDTLSDPKNSANSSFGTALALEDGVLVVGAPDTPAGTTQGVKPSITAADDGSIAASTTTGSVAVFGVKNKLGGRQKGSLLFDLLTSALADFGRSVDIDKGRILVGAPQTNNGQGSFESVAQAAYSSELSGLWYDPDFNGEGFNVVVADVGMVVFFYGYAGNGERLWLASETATGDFRFGEDINVGLFKAVKGDFDQPGSPAEALVDYGLLTMNFGSLNSATFTINGFDGNKISRSGFLADSGAYGGAYSGLWYEPAKAGEGYNVTSGEPGTIIFYYGSTNDGERLWLISDVMPDTIVEGTSFSGKMYETNGGNYYHPADPASKLQEWGTIDVRFESCTEGQFTLNGADGNKTSQVVKLAGVAGAGCN